MNVTTLPWAMPFTSSVGSVLEPEKRVLASASLRELRSRMMFRDVYFWGKVLGERNHYYLAYGYKWDILTGRYHFYSVDCMTWNALPRTSRLDRQMSLLADESFTGNPQHHIKVLAIDEQMRSTLGGAVDVTEETRLATVVAFVNHEAAVVPRGALIRREDSHVIPNDNFRGLPWDEATSLRNYYHFRAPMRNLLSNLRRRPSYDLAFDFLDSAGADVVLSFSIKVEKSDRVVVLRSLAWPGLTAYHRADTPDWGFHYMGQGFRYKLDLPVMLPATGAMAPRSVRRPAPPPAPPATPATLRSPVPAAPPAAAAADDEPAGPPRATALRASLLRRGSLQKRDSGARRGSGDDLDPRRCPSVAAVPYPRYDESVSSSPKS